MNHTESTSSLPGVHVRVQRAEFKLGRGEIHHLVDEIERAGRGERGPKKQVIIMLTFDDDGTLLRVLPGIEPMKLKKTG